jgi:hypothetical protein
LGFFGSLLLLSCPLAIRSSPELSIRAVGPIQLPVGDSPFDRAETLSGPASSGVSKCERNHGGVKRCARSRSGLLDARRALGA